MRSDSVSEILVEKDSRLDGVGFDPEHRRVRGDLLHSPNPDQAFLQTNLDDGSCQTRPVVSGRQQARFALHDADGRGLAGADDLTVPPFSNSARILSVCSPKAGTGPIRKAPSREVTGGIRLRTGPIGDSTSRQRFRSVSCGCAEKSRMFRS